ncbi:protocatechuate 3,4-dioxygenase [Photobacterium gaetbulicola]|uniref:Protocatechuate 3,4-dioxygenase beta chain protein n=1 Tax=Photobacterium gaetbulicola Gung47 TaxID=658445 RepID=A0A0C5W4Z5_9GAMM|nr:protocatechuate 3,4-dioxygenase [Photobacterium gaetbulicola]AJR06561.1 protocatechuate 3,4-dioxygenase beta chain protein [Photobacterium gaetbulicola Gung47]PSU03521.1 protocatechuate 3,4-dioxygenase [Photobacterium gaetbulicola]
MKRRHFLALWSMLLVAPSWAKKPFHVTPSQAEGPFYPVKPIPLRANLILHEQGLAGEPIELSGRVVDERGHPLPGIRVEIWQCDGEGIYDHPQQPNHQAFDRHFAGCGAAVTKNNGEYRFRTIRPVPYNRRPPHIHVKLWRGVDELLTTQLYLEGQTGNEWWGGRERQHLQFKVVKQRDVQIGEFDFVLTA